MPRAVCPRCRRPVTVCYCAALTTIDTATRVVILQHPREEGMPIGTARMASLCLPRATVHVGVRWDGSDTLRDATSDPARPAILLYPGPGARDVLADPPKGPVTLIVVDGTWSQTRTVVRLNPALASLPRYAFRAPAPSDYRIRREPKAEFVSTIEALVHVLGALEGDPERFRALLVPFRAMVDAHLARQAAAEVDFPRRSPPHLRFASHLPAAILERPGDLVCVVGDGNAWPRTAPLGDSAPELIRWTALRLASGEWFDVVVAPRGPLAPATSRHTEIDEERIRGGAQPADAVAAFAAWVRPRDVLCSWGWHGPRLFVSAGGVLPVDRIELRSVAQNVGGRTAARDRGAFLRGKVGSIESYAARCAAGMSATGVVPAPRTLAPPAPQAPSPMQATPAGRAGRRVRLLGEIVSTWRALAADEPAAGDGIAHEP